MKTRARRVFALGAVGVLLAAACTPEGAPWGEPRWGVEYVIPSTFPGAACGEENRCDGTPAAPHTPCLALRLVSPGGGCQAPSRVCAPPCKTDSDCANFALIDVSYSCVTDCNGVQACLSR